MRWTESMISELKAMWTAGIGKSAIARHLGVTSNAIIGKSRSLNLHYRGGKPMVLAHDHAAVVAGRTIFPTRLVEPKEPILKPGAYSRKLGGKVSKGPWRGMPIFTLTLEERATCPRSCNQYRGCYGNHMPQPKRYRHGAELEARLEGELLALQCAHPNGFVVRLHVLGDFYSVRYVEHWARWLDQFPALHVFGYTAWPVSSPIGRAVATLRNRRWHHFAIRTSGAGEGPRTKVIENQAEARMGEIICPAQTEKSASCATCGLCWAEAARDKTILFLRH